MTWWLKALLAWGVVGSIVAVVTGKWMKAAGDDWEREEQRWR